MKAADFKVTANLEFKKLVDNFDSRWDYITNEGSVVTLKTNENKALKYKLVNVDLSLAEPKWASLVAEKSDVLQSVAVFDGTKLILNYMHDCKDELYLYDLLTGKETKKFDIEIGTIDMGARKQDSFVCIFEIL